MRTFHIGFAMVWSVMTFAVTAADLPPRMWKAERSSDSGKTTVYLLAITHIGSTAEQDDYFQARVVPAFMTADVLEFENAQVVADQVGPCSTPLEGESASAVLEDLKDLVRFGSERRLLTTFQWVPQFAKLKNPEEAARHAAEDDTASLSEYGLVVTMMLNAAFMRSAVAGDVPESRGARIPRTTIGMLQELRPGLPEASVDAPGDLIDAYCNAGSNRLPVLKTYIEQFELRHQYGTATATADQAAATASALLFSLLEPGQKRATPMDQMLVCGRNAKWVERLSRLDDGRTYFLAIGAAHLTSMGLEEGHRCDGVQDQLRSAGFEVELVGR